MSFPGIERQGQDMRDGEDTAPWIPSPQEIKERAAMIRSTWSKAEFQKRAGIYGSKSVFVIQSHEPKFSKRTIV